MAIRLTINGEKQVFHGDPRTSLLEVLRDTFRLTGAKDVCGEGFCGTCNVHINGEALPACLRPIGMLEGAEVTTIEGLSPMGTFNAVQAALEKHDVVQCGMCFPGLVMTMSKFFETNSNPSRAEIKSAMTGNLCRCTGYELIVDALASIADERGLVQ